jgi:hypothetical protein
MQYYIALEPKIVLADEGYPYKSVISELTSSRRCGGMYPIAFMVVVF